MTINVDVQNATQIEPLPEELLFVRWVGAALQGKSDVELTLRLVDRDESRALNLRYRGHDFE